MRQGIQVAEVEVTPEDEELGRGRFVEGSGLLWQKALSVLQDRQR
jgi:hypothetical protein